MRHSNHQPNVIASTAAITSSYGSKTWVNLPSDLREVVHLGTGDEIDDVVQLANLIVDPNGTPLSSEEPRAIWAY